MKSKYFLLLSFSVLSITSCKDILETRPLDSLTPINYYQTEVQLKSALAGVYDVMGKPQTYSDQMSARMGLTGDEAYYSRTSGIGVAVYDVSATDPIIENNYSFWYQGIKRANFLLENIDKAKVDSVVKREIRGEALFLRGFYHFQLVTHWGAVPLMIRSISGPTEVNFPRTPAKEVYEQIIKDMTDAEAMVGSIAKAGSGRVNKSAVRGILARVCLHMAGAPINDVAKYADAKKWAAKVMDPASAGGYSHALNPSYADVFIRMCQDKYDLGESIWEVEFYGNDTGPYRESGRIGSNNGIVYTGEDPNYGYSYGFIRQTARLWTLYPGAKALLSEDERREWAIAPYLTAGTPVVETPFSTSQIYERTSGKWRRELEVVFPKIKNTGPCNFPLLRYSDVLLMFAEADNHLTANPAQEAIDAVNLVRRRAYGKNLPFESVKMTQITTGGSGYNNNNPPTVTISGGGGTGATGKAFVSSGRVVRIKMLTEGEGYTTAPTITISGGGGTGAVAISLLSNRRNSIADLTATQTASQESFQQVIEDERSRELCFELLRKTDLIRWGKFLTNMKLVENDFLNGGTNNGVAVPRSTSSSTSFGVAAFSNASARDVLWPFSPSEMALNRALRPQNPGF